MKHYLENHSYTFTLEGLSSRESFKTLGPETEIRIFVRVSTLVQFFFHILRLREPRWSN